MPGMLADGPRTGNASDDRRASAGGMLGARRTEPLGERRNCLTLEGLMAERCELCGARWEVGTFKCRDCGSRRRVTVQPEESSASMPGLAIVREALAQGAVPTANESSSGVAMPSSVSTIPPTRLAAPASAAPSPALSSPSPAASFSSGAVQTVLPPGFSQPLTRPAGGRALVLLGAAAAVAVAVGVTVWLTTQPAAEPEAKLAPVEVHVGAEEPGCEQLAALAGSWVFTTATTGARRKERLGVRGFYQLQIIVDGCTARATLAKTGRTDRTMFDDDKIPRAEATLTRGEGMEAYGFGGTFVLRNEDGQGIDTRFVVALEGERLVGSWRQLGERWQSSGLYGVLEGRRDGDPVAILPERSTQPCTVRCATPEDIALIDVPDEAAHAACLASCE